MKSEVKGCLGCLGIIGALCLVVGITWIVDPEYRARLAKDAQEGAALRQEKAKDPKSQLASQACRELQYYVEPRLTAPSTAKFPFCVERDSGASYKGNGHYAASSYVDSQNGFGAMIRMHYWGDVEVITLSDAEGRAIKDSIITNFSHD